MILDSWTVYSIGKAGLEKHLELPAAVAVEQMVFVEEQVRGGRVNALRLFRSRFSFSVYCFCGKRAHLWLT